MVGVRAMFPTGMLRGVCAAEPEAIVAAARFRGDCGEIWLELVEKRILEVAVADGAGAFVRGCFETCAACDGASAAAKACRRHGASGIRGAAQGGCAELAHRRNAFGTELCRCRQSVRPQCKDNLRRRAQE